jgi:hypothetical protein
MRMRGQDWAFVCKMHYFVTVQKACEKPNDIMIQDTSSKSFEKIRANEALKKEGVGQP